MDPYLPVHIRNINRRTVLALFRQHLRLTRADVTRLSNLSFPTVMKIVDYMLSKEIIAEVTDSAAVNDGALGRKGQLLTLNENAYSTIGIHFEGNYLLAGLVNINLGILEQKSFPLSDLRDMSFPHNATRISTLMTDTIRYFCSSHPESRVIGVGVALPVAIEANTEKIRRREFGAEPVTFYELFETFKEIRDLPIYIENDMNAAAFGEWLLRKEEKSHSLSYIALGTGLGGGIIIDGEIWHGNSNFSGDFGSTLSTLRHHIKSGEQADSLILENQINIAAIKREFDVDILGTEHIPDEIKLKINDHVADYLVPFIVNLCHILDTSSYVIAGLIPEFLGDMLYKQINEDLQKIFSHRKLFPTLQVLSPMSKNAGIVGAGAIAFRQSLSGLLGDDA